MTLKKLVRKGKPPHRKPSLEPQTIDGVTWFYDDKKWLLVVHEFRDKEKYFRTDQFIIPWQAVMAAARRNGR